MHAYSAVKGKCSVTKMSAQQRQIASITLNVFVVVAEAYDTKVNAQLEFNRNTKSKFRRLRHCWHGRLTGFVLVLAAVLLLLLLSTRGCRDSVWAPTATADSPDSEWHSGRLQFCK